MRALIISAILFFAGYHSTAQNSDCIVLQDSISGSYEGECKKGKAHGLGKAQGMHTYEGTFKKGRPFGEGIYTWDEGRWFKGLFRNGMKNGYGELHSNRVGEDPLLKGYWRNNHYIGKEDIDDYEIVEQYSLENVSVILRDNEGASLRVKILRDKATNSNARITTINSSSGHARRGSGSVVYENIEFPFHFSIYYDTPSRFGATTISCYAIFIINTPGEWEISLEI